MSWTKESSERGRATAAANREARKANLTNIDSVRSPGVAEVPERRHQRSSVVESDSPFAQHVSADEEFIARNQGIKTSTTEVLNEEMAPTGNNPVNTRALGKAGKLSGVVLTTHTRPDMRMLYKKTDNGWAPVMVSSSNVATLLQEPHWSSFCPDCNGHHGDSPNDCPGRTPIARRICPVCGASTWDNYQINSEAATLALMEDDPNIIRDSNYSNSTAASRTKAGLDRHMWIRHPAETAAMGIAPLPEPPTADLENKLNQLPRYAVQAGGQSPL